MKYTTLQDSFFHYYWQNISERFASFEGKTSREEYWMFTLWSAIVTVILSVISVGTLGAIYSILIAICHGSHGIMINRLLDPTINTLTANEKQNKPK